MLVIASLMATSGLNGWAEWLEFLIVLGGAIFGLIYWLKTLYDRRRIFTLSFGFSDGESAKTSTAVPTGESGVDVRIGLRRPLDFTTATLVLSDTHDGVRRARVGDLAILDVMDAGSPGDLRESHKHPSNSLFRLAFDDAPIHRSSEEEFLWTVNVRSSQPWAGYLVFVSYDDAGNRRYGSGRISFRADAARTAARIVSTGFKH